MTVDFEYSFNDTYYYMKLVVKSEKPKCKFCNNGIMTIVTDDLIHTEPCFWCNSEGTNNNSMSYEPCKCYLKGACIVKDGNNMCKSYTFVDENGNCITESPIFNTLSHCKLECEKWIPKR